MKELLNRMIALRTEYQELYGNGLGEKGLISIEGGRGIQVTEDYLLRIPGDMTESKREGCRYPWMYQKVYEGTVFYAVTDKQLEVGL